ncbi:MAG: hypothetical protein AB1486_34245 [Planctomycetota bacterium]
MQRSSGDRHGGAGTERLKGDSSGAETIVETVVREIRETGVGLVAIDQMPAGFPKMAVGRS